MDTFEVEETIRDIAERANMRWYKRYASSIVPENEGDLFRRWLFAYSSVHTTWESNLALYLQLKDYESWLGDEAELKARIVRSRAGLYNNRTRYIMDFAAKFWQDPKWYWRQRGEAWNLYRDRIADSALGIGLAKSSFVVEMTYPTEAEVICTDTHMIQAYGYTPAEASKVPDRREREMEIHWVGLCQAYALSAPLTRWAVWDIKQRRKNPRYWTHVLEKPVPELRLEVEYVEARRTAAA